MSEAGPVQRFFGAALMAVGVLVMALCGICSTCGVIMGLTDPTFGGGDTIGLVLLIGGVPFAIGLGTFFAGKALRGRPLERPVLPPVNFKGDDTP
jgi:hypothetical protein